MFVVSVSSCPTEPHGPAWRTLFWGPTYGQPVAYTAIRSVVTPPSLSVASITTVAFVAAVSSLSTSVNQTGAARLAAVFHVVAPDTCMRADAMPCGSVIFTE